MHWALEQLPTGETNLIFTPNPEIVYRAWHDPVFYQALTSADLLVPDGIGVVWAAARLGQPVPERVPGYDLMIHLLAALARRHGMVFFLGARPEVVQAAAQVASRRWPGLVVTGYHHGYFQPGQEEQAVLQKIRAAAPDLLLVALGAGKQEEWLAFHRAELQVPLAIAVGGSFDVWQGSLSGPPPGCNACIWNGCIGCCGSPAGGAGCWLYPGLPGPSSRLGQKDSGCREECTKCLPRN